jgi:hypothetical protein
MLQLMEETLHHWDLELFLGRCWRKIMQMFETMDDHGWSVAFLLSAGSPCPMLEERTWPGQIWLMNAKSKESPAVLTGHSGFPWHWSFCLRPETDMNWREKSRSFHITYIYTYMCVCYIYYHIFGIIRISIKINQWISPKTESSFITSSFFSINGRTGCTSAEGVSCDVQLHWIWEAIHGPFFWDKAMHVFSDP